MGNLSWEILIGKSALKIRYSKRSIQLYLLPNLVSAGGAALVGGVWLAAALALAIAGTFINFGVLITGHVLIRDGAEALGILRKVGFGLGVLEVEKGVVLVFGRILLGL